MKIELGDDKTLYKLMLQDIPTCFGIAYIKKMHTWSFFVASALLVERLDTLVSWLTDELNLDATEIIKIPMNKNEKESSNATSSSKKKKIDIRFYTT